MIDFWRSEVTEIASIAIDGEDWEKFKELVQRGSNLWPDAPPSIKVFADQVTNNKVMQDYYKQTNVPNPTGE
jgi:mannose/fructose/N-acetylgalactosamine-specific phosphotransferase system component IIB